MRQIAVAVSVALIMLTGCGSLDEQTETSVPSSNTTTLFGPVTYTSQEVGQLPGIVDLVQRDRNDLFFYVVSRMGVIERWRLDGSRLDTVLDISAATTPEGERGLLGLAFRKNSSKWEAFINFTDVSGTTIISRFDVHDDGTLIIDDLPTGKTILTISQPYSNHNGGALAVGPDNMLYVGTGDGGSSNDPERRALDTSQLLGKILRINPRLDGYDIPKDNPFNNDSTARGEIWSIGLRNPWRFTFDVSGNIWIADVGQNKWEEVNVSKGTTKIPGGRGVSFGWSAFEGNHVLNSDVQASDAIKPVFEYEHKDGACSISGGAIGNNTITPGRAGWYFFGDYCTGIVTAVLTDGSSTVASETVVKGLGNITAVRNTAHAMFVMSIGGQVHRLTSQQK